MWMEGKVEMAKRMKLPKEGLAGSELRPRSIDETDVEGHGLPTTAPPALIRRGPNNGGELRPRSDEDDDVEGHKRR